jgi:predicted peptidase
MATVLRNLILASCFLVVTAVDSTLNFLTSSNRARSYWIHTPDVYDQTKSYPVVIAFHGSSKIGFDVDGFALEADIRLTLPFVPTKYSKDVSLPCLISVSLG